MISDDLPGLFIDGPQFCCPCCGKPEERRGCVRGFSCDCTWGFCKECFRCSKHCPCVAKKAAAREAMQKLIEESQQPVKRNAARRVIFTHRCIYCAKYFNTFGYAWWHIQECHQRSIDAHRMTYPILLRPYERFVVIMEKLPKKRGYLRKNGEINNGFTERVLSAWHDALPAKHTDDIEAICVGMGMFPGNLCHGNDEGARHSVGPPGECQSGDIK